MSGNLLLDAVFWFFAVLGLISLLESVAHMIMRWGQEDEDLYVVLTVKNQQDTVEALIRSIVWQNLPIKKGGMVPEIVIVDMGSNDDTPSIIKRLEQDYDFIHATDKQGYIEWIKKMSK